MLVGCAKSLRDRAWMEGELLARLGAGTKGAATALMPSGIGFNDGLDEAEVTAIVLWRNPALRTELTRIDSARATLDEARRPANPQLSMMGALGPVTAVATLLVPIESLWQMPFRTKAAAKEADSTAEAVLMRALDLVRDARLLHAELGLALDRAEIRRELANVSAELARIASVRARLGEISALDERLFYADARVTADASDLAGTDLVVARARLVAHLALDGGEAANALRATFLPAPSAIPALPELLRVARAARPDARSADLAISAAVARAGWERSRAISIGALVEGHWSRTDGPALRLGGRADLPIFGANPGGIGRADAEIARVTAQHEVVAQTARLEVTSAHARALQAARSLARFEDDVLPALNEALLVAKNSFETGDETYLVVLDVLRRLGDARLRRAELIAERRRAQCELDRAIGARLGVAHEVAARAEEHRQEADR